MAAACPPKAVDMAALLARRSSFEVAPFFERILQNQSE
jgi:hypothetical protein